MAPLERFLLSIPTDPTLVEGLNSLNSTSMATSGSFDFDRASSEENLCSHTNPDEPDLLNVSVDLCRPAIFFFNLLIAGDYL